MQQRQVLRSPSQPRLPFIDIYKRITANINEHAINPLANFAPFAEFGVFVCVPLGPALVCVPDADPLFPVPVMIAVEVDTTAELEVDTPTELDRLVDPLGIAASAVPSAKPQSGAAGPAGALTHTSITH
jgi:hypothetical protein